MERVLIYGMTNNLGGIESYIMTLLEEAGDRIQFDFVTDFPSIAREEVLRERGCRIFYIPAKSKGVFAHRRAFLKILKEHPELRTVYFNVLDAGSAITMQVAKSAGRRVVVHSHNNSTEKVLLHKMMKPVLNLIATARFACSEQAAEFMFGHRDAVIVPNAIDAEHFAYDPEKRRRLRAELGISPETAVILHVGRLSLQKNPFRLLQIFEAFHQRRPDSVLLWTGTGELADEVHDAAGKSPARDAVRFLGLREDIADLYSAADLFLLPSKYEGLGIVLIEAQSSGLPSLASSVVPAAAGLTDSLEYFDLEKSDEEWAKKLESMLGERHAGDLNAIAAAGYDKNHPSAATLELFDCLSSASRG